ncbi:MAG: hypothetical protein ABSC13_09800 [Dehalococcoidia bacterium]|jgi:hypothetical protein
MKRILKFALPFALLAIVVSGVLTGVALAQGGGNSGTASPTTRMDQFLGFLSNRLGISSDQLKTDVQGAASDTVNQMLKDGTITQQQADKLNQEIQNGNFPGFLGMGGRFGGFGMMGKGALGTSLQNIVQSVAGKLNLTPQQIQTQLKSGKSLADIASAQGVSRDDLKNDITTAVNTEVDNAVSGGKITQSQGDNIKSMLSSNLDQLIDHTGGLGGLGGIFGGKGQNGNGQNNKPNSQATPNTPNTSSPMWRGGTQNSRTGMSMPFM